MAGFFIFSFFFLFLFCMKKIILLLIISISSFYANAQSWKWARAGQHDGEGIAVCTDNAGNIIITGFFVGDSIRFGNFTLYNNSNFSKSDLYVVKYDSLGNVLWAQSAGSSDDEMAIAICADASGNIYITGYFDSPSIVIGGYPLINSGPPGSTDMYVAKYNASGVVVWARSANGNNSDWGSSVATDNFGNVYVTGGSLSNSITFGSYTLPAGFFMVKYNSLANVVWAQTSSGPGSISGAICSDVFSNVYMAGQFYGTSVNLGSFTLNNSVLSGNNFDAFLAKFDGNGNVLWVKTANDTSGSEMNAIASDSSGNIYVTGDFYDNMILGNFTLLNSSSWNMFTAKYDSSGSVIWAKTVSGCSLSSAYSISADTRMQCYVTGTFYGNSISFDSISLTRPIGDPMFIVQYDTAGKAICGSVLASGGDDMNGVSADRFGNVYITGDFAVSPFVVGNDTLTLSGIGEDVFTAKWISCAKMVNDNYNAPTDLFLPNAFSPNGDGMNDIFIIRGNNIASAYLAVYNRWGEKVFETTDQSTGWDGTFRGKSCNVAVYAYYLRATMKDGKELVQKGNVSLIR